MLPAIAILGTTERKVHWGSSRGPWAINMLHGLVSPYGTNQHTASFALYHTFSNMRSFRRFPLLTMLDLLILHCTMHFPSCARFGALRPPYTASLKSCPCPLLRVTGLCSVAVLKYIKKTQWGGVEFCPCKTSCKINPARPQLGGFLSLYGNLGTS